MSFLVLTNGVTSITVPVSTSAPPVKWILIGDMGSAFDGAPLGSITDRRRQWNVPTTPLSQAAAASLRTLLNDNPILTASGDWVGAGSVSVWPSLQEEAPVTTVPYKIKLNFTLDEVP